MGTPKIKNEYQMDFFQWSTKDPLTVNKFGIPEPTSNKIMYPNIFLIVREIYYNYRFQWKYFPFQIFFFHHL